MKCDEVYSIVALLGMSFIRCYYYLIIRHLEKN